MIYNKQNTQTYQVEVFILIYHQVLKWLWCIVILLYILHVLNSFCILIYYFDFSLPVDLQFNT